MPFYITTTCQVALMAEQSVRVEPGSNPHLDYEVLRCFAHFARSPDSRASKTSLESTYGNPRRFMMRKNSSSLTSPSHHGRPRQSSLGAPHRSCSHQAPVLRASG